MRSNLANIAIMIVVALLLLGGIVLGIVLVVVGIQDNALSQRFAAAAVTPLSGLAALAGTGQPVRFEARALGRPPLSARSEEVFAYQHVRIEHERSTGTGSDRKTETVVDYERSAPPNFAAGDGTTEVLVKAEEIDTLFVPRRTSADVNRDGTLPAEVAALLDPAFEDIPIERLRGINAEVIVHAIAKDAPLTIYGNVRSEGGRLVVEPPAKGRFIVSPLSPTEIAAAAKSSGLLFTIIGACVLVFSLGLSAFFGIKTWRGERIKVRTRGSVTIASKRF